MIELQHLCYDVEQDGELKHILKDISLTIDERFVAITGPNGGGKSTLAKVIAGILPPTQGRILFDGEDITGLSITDRARRGISFAFQQPVRFKGLTVKDLITLAAGRPIGVPEACAYLSEVGLCAKDYIDRELDASLSGGEVKRIEIAMIMARATKLSLFENDREVRKEELPESMGTRIFVFERESQFELLSGNPNTYMQVSPIPKRMLERFGLVQREFDGDSRMYKDVLVHRHDYTLTDLDKQFISCLIDEKREIFG